MYYYSFTNFRGQSWYIGRILDFIQKLQFPTLGKGYGIITSLANFRSLVLAHYFIQNLEVPAPDEKCTIITSLPNFRSLVLAY